MTADSSGAVPSAIRHPQSPVIHVACGVLVDAAGRVLLAQRPEGKIAAGWWEFPGGKIEAAETALAALTRELAEELGVVVRAAEPLIRFSHHYSNRTVVLDTWRVTAFDGEPRGCEGQALRWLAVPDFRQVSPLLPTVTPIERALQTPDHYVFTPPAMAIEKVLTGLSQLPRGAWLRLRLPLLDDAQYEIAARAVLLQARPLGIKIFVDRAAERVTALGADGWHCTSAVLMQLKRHPFAPLDPLPSPSPQGGGAFHSPPPCGEGLGEGVVVPLTAVSVHNEQQLAHAEALGFNAAVLGPVLPTATHADAAVLGWAGFAALRADRALPVLAIGGLGAAQQAEARAANAQGVAGISAYWRGGGS